MVVERLWRTGHNGPPLTAVRKAVWRLALAAALLLAGLGPAWAAPLPAPSRAAPAARPAWTRAIDRVVAGLPVGVSVREDRAYLYRHADVRRRAPASNEKLLLSMAILDRLGPDATLVTQAATVVPVTAGVLAGDLWILGTGDPDVRAPTMERLARAISAAGVLRIDGSVLGSTGYFKRDWFAPGWKRDFPRTQVALPTALTFEGNQAGGVHIGDPELRAAKALTTELRRLGVSVAAPAGSGKAPAGLVPVAEVTSDPLIDLVETMDRYSANFWAEVLGKRLGAEASGQPGSIAKGAGAIHAYAGGHGVVVKSRDSSGLSYANRVSPSGLVRLLDVAEDAPWGEALREALPQGGQGTLQGRLRHVPVHAKTGTLTSISALSGWVWLRKPQVWAEFSILSRGLSKDAAVRIEDRVVRILWRDAT
jgi:D-alanyl-D-alanine carboxypeptidase/D-alanyl-D-alanine-endopeptidase (penicillin-binding protein 4)